MLGSPFFYIFGKYNESNFRWFPAFLFRRVYYWVGGGGVILLLLSRPKTIFFIKTHFEAFLWLCKVKYRSEKPRMDITRPRRDKSLIENN